MIGPVTAQFTHLSCRAHAASTVHAHTPTTSCTCHHCCMVHIMHAHPPVAPCVPMFSLLTFQVAEKLGLPTGAKARALTRATSYSGQKPKAPRPIRVKIPDSKSAGWALALRCESGLSQNKGYHAMLWCACGNGPFKTKRHSEQHAFLVPAMKLSMLQSTSSQQADIAVSRLVDGVYLSHCLSVACGRTITAVACFARMPCDLSCV